MPARRGVIAHRFRQQFRILAGEFGLGVGIGLHRRVNVLAIIQSDHPGAELLDAVRGGVPHCGVGAGLLDHREPVGHEGELKIQVVQSADRVLKSHLSRTHPANAVEGRVSGGERLRERGLDFIGGGFERRHADDRVKLGGALLKIAQRVGAGAGRASGAGDGQAHPHRTDANAANERSFMDIPPAN